jgi:hypothetical protein
MPPDHSTDAEGSATARLLRERLRSPIPVERFAVESLQKALGRVSRDVLPLAGVPVGELLLDPRVDLTTLVALKNCAKKLAARLSQPGAEYNAMVTIYFAAIASARVFHRRTISTHAPETLTQAFQRLHAQPWMPWELAELFTKATAT